MNIQSVSCNYPKPYLHMVNKDRVKLIQLIHTPEGLWSHVEILFDDGSTILLPPHNVTSISTAPSTPPAPRKK